MNNKKDIIERIDEFYTWYDLFDKCVGFECFDETLLEDCKKEILRQRSIIDNLLKNIGEI